MRRHASGVRPCAVKKRTTYDTSFKLQVVREALLRPVDNRIKPTCARYPGIEPCQLRKWIRNLEGEARVKFEGEINSSRKRQRVSPVTVASPIRRSSRPRKPTARGEEMGEEGQCYEAEDSEREDEFCTDESRSTSVASTGEMKARARSGGPEAASEYVSSRLIRPVGKGKPPMEEDAQPPAEFKVEPEMAPLEPLLLIQNPSAEGCQMSSPPTDEEGAGARCARWCSLTPHKRYCTDHDYDLPGALRAACFNKRSPFEAHDANRLPDKERPLSMVSSIELASMVSSAPIAAGGLAGRIASVFEDVSHDQWFAEWLSEVTSEED